MALKLPESPRYLVSKNRLDEARNVLVKYTNEANPDLKLEQIKISFGQSEMTLFSIKKCFYQAKPYLYQLFGWQQSCFCCTVHWY